MANDRLWYDKSLSEAEQAERLTDMARSLWNEQGLPRRRLAEDALTLWAGTTQHSLAGMSPAGVLGLVDETAGYNVVQAIVDTKVNHTLRNEVRPLFMTEGGDSDLREKVDAMQDACDGQRDVLELEEIEEVTCWNAYIFGTGGEEYSADVANSRILVAPVWHWNYMVSRQEARSGKSPRQLFSRQVIPRDVLLSFLADSSADVLEAVKNAPAASWDDAKEYDAGEQGKVADLVIVWKGWHLPSGRVDLSDPRAFGKGEKDGRKVAANHDGLHMVCLDGTKSAPPLLVRPWPYDHFPVAWFKPNRMPGSYWGRGEPEILASGQIEANQWNERVYQILDRHARPAIILSKSAKLNPAMINNSPFNIWQVEGNAAGAMTLMNEPAVPGDLINRLDRLPQQARDQRGMSEMSMTARRPAGIEHKPGLKYLADTETIRHIVEFRAWKRYNLDRYKNIIRCFSELSEHDPKFEVIFEKDDQLTRQKWSDINADSSQYRVKEKGTNLFSQDPAEQAEQIADLVERGLLPPSALFQAVKSPDLQALADDREILRKNAIALVKRVIKGPEYDDTMMPTPYHDLETCKAEGLKAFNRLQLNGEKADKIDRVVDFLQDVDQLLGITPPAMPDQGQMAGAMNAAGGPPPALQGPPPGPAGVTVAPPTLQ